MSLDLLKENLIIEICVEEEYKGRYPSRIEEVRRRTLLIAAPTQAGSVVPLRYGEEIIINFYHKDDYYSFPTRVINRFREPIPILEVEKPTQMKKIQRRQYVRLEENLYVQFRRVALNEGNQVVPVEEEYMEGMTIDISGGGILLSTQAEIQARDLLELLLFIPQREPLPVLGRALRILANTGTGEKNNIAIRFEKIRESHRDIIIGYIFQKQRELIKKGLL